MKVTHKFDYTAGSATGDAVMVEAPRVLLDPAGLEQRLVQGVI